jgi:putative ABC transport system permease protein
MGILSPELLRIALRGQGWRGLLSVLAIAIGVALGQAVQAIHGAALGEMEQAARVLTGEADLVLRATHGGFEEALYPRIAALPEVAAASPVLELEARVEGRRGKLRVRGVDAFRVAELQPGALARELADPLDALRPDRLFLSPEAAHWLGVAAGDELALQSGLGWVRLRVAGLVDLPGARLGLMDIAGAQAAFGRLGRLSALELRLAPGVAPEAFAARLEGVLPAGVRAEAPEAGTARALAVTRAYRVNLNLLALVALFTGGLLVFSSQALAVVRRRAQFALLRALGLTRGQLLRLVLLDGAATGALGGALGVALGHGLATFLLGRIGADLGAAYFAAASPRLAFEPLAAGAFLLLGVGASLAGTLMPALECARAAPAQALHAGDEERAFARLPHPGRGLALMALGGAAALAPPVAELPLFGYAAIGLLLLGCIALLPRAAAAVFALLPRPRAPVAQLALLQLQGAPGQAAVSLAPLVASIALAAAMAIMVGSFRHSLIDWLERVLPADLYLRAGTAGDTGSFSLRQQAALAALPGMVRAEFGVSEPLSVEAGRPDLVLLAREIDPTAPGRSLPLVAPPRLPAPGETPAWVSEVAAGLYGWRVGDGVVLTLAGRPAPFVVAGIWRDYARGQGAVVIERRVHRALTGEEGANEAALWVAPGTSGNALREAVRRLLPAAAVEAALPAELRERSLALFDRTFAATYALEAVALAIGVAGLSASFAALVLARRREFGVLRHLGLRRRDIGGVLAAQGVLLAGLALAVGLALGWLLSLVLVHVVNRQSFHWSMELAMPWGALAAFSAALLLLAVATAFVSGGQAMRREAVLVVKEDW